MEQLSYLKGFSLSEKLTLVFCGTFSSGKSSIINLLLEQEFKLPTGANPVTKFVTRLTYGEEFQAVCICDKESHILSREELDAAITGKLKLPEDCSEITIKTPARILKNGVEILDTPGYLDNAELTEITRAAVLTADIAFFCCNAAIVGKKFELDYFSELEECIGNFCVIVNHLDSINTVEDFIEVKGFIEDKISGRGKVALKLFVGRNIFYTIAAGTNVSLNGFKDFAFRLCTNARPKFIRRLKIYAAKKKIAYKLRKMTEETQAQITLCEISYPLVEKELEAEYQKALKDHLEECKKISEKIKYILDEAVKQFDDAVQDIEDKFDSLEKDEIVGWIHFQEKADSYLKTTFRAIPAFISKWLKEKLPQINFDEKNLFRNYLAELEKYSVPEVVGRRVKVRDTGERILFTVLNFITLDPGIDDGYHTEYEGYAAAAKLHMEENLTNKIKLEMKSCLKKLEVEVTPKQPEKTNDILQKMLETKTQWENLNDQINTLLDCYLENLESEKIDRQIYPDFEEPRYNIFAGEC